MKTQSLKVKKIDGLDVIIGFQNRPIDPVGTQRGSAQSILDLPESLALKEKNDIQNGHRLKFIEARKKAKAFLALATPNQWGVITGDPKRKNEYKSESTKQDKIANDLVGTMNTTNEELKVLSMACKTACQKVLTDNPVYFEPRANEIVKTQAEIDDLTQKFDTKSPETQLLENGEYVNDERGKVYHEKIEGVWSKTAINNLAITKPSGAKYSGELTDTEKSEIETQEESDRLAGLSAEEKTAEYESRKSGLANQAQNMENGLKFDGDIDYMSKAQDFYNTELDKLKTEYGVV